MKREELIAKGYSEEQVTELLNMFHKNNENLTKENETLKNQISENNERIAQLNQVENEFNKIKQSQLTDQEKIALMQKDLEQKNLEAENKIKQSNKILNMAKAKVIFSEIGGIDENVLNTIVTDNEETTINNANALLNQFKSIKEQTVNKTKEEISSLDIKPVASNNLETNSKITWEMFDKMSSEEQNKFQAEHPQEFAEL